MACFFCELSGKISPRQFFGFKLEKNRRRVRLFFRVLRASYSSFPFDWSAWLQQKAECLGGDHCHSLMEDDHRDSSEVAEDDCGCVGIWSTLGLILGPKLDQSLQLLRHLGILLGVCVDACHFAIDFCDRLIKVGRFCLSLEHNILS